MMEHQEIWASNVSIVIKWHPDPRSIITQNYLSVFLNKPLFFSPFFSWIFVDTSDFDPFAFGLSQILTHLNWNPSTNTLRMLNTGCKLEKVVIFRAIPKNHSQVFWAEILGCNLDARFVRLEFCFMREFYHSHVLNLLPMGSH